MSLVLAVFLVLGAWAGPVAGDALLPTPEQPHYDLELLYTDGSYDEGLKLARERLTAHPDDADLYWHVIRFMFEVGERYDRNDKSVDKVALYQEMDALADQGLALSPGHAHLLFAKGIALGRLGTTRGVLSSLFLAKTVEQSWLSAATSDYRYSSLGGEEQLPCDAMLTLGIFYRLVPESWVVQALAGTRGDMARSVEYTTAADACSPNRIVILKELGVAQLCYGQKRGDEASIRAGIATLGRVVAMPGEDDTDAIDKRHAAMLLANPKLACEYSRDGQQDLDTSKLEAK